MNQSQVLALLAEARSLLDDGMTPEDVAKEIEIRIFTQARVGERRRHSEAMHKAWLEWLHTPDREED